MYSRRAPRAICLAAALVLGWSASSGEDRPGKAARTEAAASYDNSRILVLDQIRQATDHLAIPALNASVTDYLRQGRKDLAVLLQEQIVRLQESGPDPVSTAGVRALYRLGTFRKQIGPYDEAESLFRDALDLHARVDDASPALMSVILRSLAEVIGRLRPDDAERETLLLRVLSLEESPGNHARMGEYYASVGRHAEALMHFDRGLELERGMEVRHPERQANLLLSMAEHHRSAEQFQDAEWFALRALELREGLLGPRHPRLAPTLKKVGEIYFEQERLHEAEHYLTRAAELDQSAWGTQSGRCNCGAGAMLTQVRQALGKAEPQGAPPLVEYEEPSPDDPLLEQLQALDLEIAGMARRGEFATAVDATQDALRLAEVLYGLESLEVSDRLSRLGGLQKQAGRLDDAAGTMLENVDMLERMEQADPARLVGALQAMGHALRGTGRKSEAERILVRELELRDLLGHNLMAAHLLETLGHLHRERGDFDEAHAYYRRAEERWVDTVGPEAPDILGVRAAVARAYMEQERLAEAESLLLELAAEAADRASVEPHMLRRILTPLAELYRSRGDEEAWMGVEATLREIRRTIRAN